jgi:hypothetical protein
MKNLLLFLCVSLVTFLALAWALTQLPAGASERLPLSGVGSTRRLIIIIVFESRPARRAGEQST